MPKQARDPYEAAGEPTAAAQRPAGTAGGKRPGPRTYGGPSHRTSLLLPVDAFDVAQADCVAMRKELRQPVFPKEIVAKLLELYAAGETIGGSVRDEVLNRIRAEHRVQ